MSIDDKELTKYKGRVEEWLANLLKRPKSFHKEQNTTIRFIVPLLQLLGWDPLSNATDIEFEYDAKNKELKKRGSADIALYGKSRSKPKIIIEVKRIQDEEGKTGKQVLRYLKAKGIKFGIYTNGQEIKLIDNRTPVKYIPEGLFTIKVKDFIKYKEVLAIFSKESVQKTEALEDLARDFHSKNFWGGVKEQERVKGKTKAQKAEDKYYLRLDYAKRRLQNKSRKT